MLEPARSGDLAWLLSLGSLQAQWVELQRGVRAPEARGQVEGGPPDIKLPNPALAREARAWWALFAQPAEAARKNRDLPADLEEADDEEGLESQSPPSPKG